MKLITTFPNQAEFEKIKIRLDGLGLKYTIIDPAITYSMVGMPAIKVDPEVRFRLAESNNIDYVCSGWVDCPDKLTTMPDDEPPSYAEDIFGRAVIMVLAPCVADTSKIRLIAHTEKDISLFFPYINSQMDNASFIKSGLFCRLWTAFA